MAPGLTFMDEEAGEVVLDREEAAALLAITDRLDAATVSACPDCCSRVLAAVALIDLLDGADAHARSIDLIEFADEAPTLHVYVIDDTRECDHDRWRDPLYDEWADVVETSGPHALA